MNIREFLINTLGASLTYSTRRYGGILKSSGQSYECVVSLNKDTTNAITASKTTIKIASGVGATFEAAEEHLMSEILCLGVHPPADSSAEGGSP